MYKYAGVIVNNDSIQLDRIFTYGIPEDLIEKISLGYRVKVPFGLGNKKLDGFIIELYDECENLDNIKYISELCDDFPILSVKDLELIRIMKERYICTYLECIKALIPSGITKGLKKKTSDVICIGKTLEGKYDKEPYTQIYNFISKNNGRYNKNELVKSFNISQSSVNTLIKYGFLLQDKVIINRFNEKNYEQYEKKTLNSEQRAVVESILASNDQVFLIHGVTGSGKTEVYMHLVTEMIKKNKETIILVPEISLTPQMIERFKGRFGKDICVFHSKLSEGERYDEWMRVKEGKVKLAIGARSAVFLPFNNLGLIIIDEEHEASYKSDSDPKYHAREIAEIRTNIEGAKLILGSATPSIESYFNAVNNDIVLLKINNRADNAAMPDVTVIDMREELISNNRSIFSRELYKSIRENLNKKEQTILFLNRRGFSTFVSCRQCGFVFKCSNCDISLTYHSGERTLNCHYCGNKQSVPTVCPKCRSKYVKYFGVGTERVEQEISRYFPDAKVLRMDLDTTRKKNSHENIYTAFKNKKADILVGTQMIAKGLDFKDVTLVGVIAADLSLNLPDYRSAERTFQLLTQVSGRAGRGEKPGKVIIQTYNPDNFSIQNAASNSYIEFFNQEIKVREDMNYPPFSKILCINLSSKNEDLLIKNIQNIGIFLKDMLQNHDKIDMLGPCPCSISKIKELFRWQIILKGDIDYTLANEIRLAVYNLLKENRNDIRVGLDINPNSLL